MTLSAQDDITGTGIRVMFLKLIIDSLILLSTIRMYCSLLVRVEHGTGQQGWACPSPCVRDPFLAEEMAYEA
jgi:hypothetical protein